MGHAMVRERAKQASELSLGNPERRGETPTFSLKDVVKDVKNLGVFPKDVECILKKDLLFF